MRLSIHFPDYPAPSIRHMLSTDGFKLLGGVPQVPQWLLHDALAG